jgi:hypothetical protein
MTEPVYRENAELRSAPAGDNQPANPQAPIAHINNYFNSNYGCVPETEVSRIICLDDGKVKDTVIGALGPPPGPPQSPYNRMVVVLVNDGQYGGGGPMGGFARSYNGNDPNGYPMKDVVKHESGHSFAFLADEYSGGGTCNPNASAVNITNTYSRALIPWNNNAGTTPVWIDSSTPLPTDLTVSNVPGAYQGADYCTTGLYRPTYSSKMNVPTNGWNSINAEQWVYRIYSNMEFPDGASQPFQSYSLDDNTVTVSQGTVETFEPAVPNPSDTNLTYTWTEGPEYGTQSPISGCSSSALSCSLDTSGLPYGNYIVQVTIKDTNRMVNPASQYQVPVTSPNNLPPGTVTWLLTVTCATTSTSTYYYGPPFLQNGSWYVEEHEVTDTTDCNNNQTTNDAVIAIVPFAFQCVLVEAIYPIQYGPYEDEYGDTCYDDYEDDIYQCTDGNYYADFYFVQTECVSSIIY